MSTLTSCEYELKSENFQNVAVPDTSLKVVVNLSPEDTLYTITRPTVFTYDLNTFDLKFNDVTFFLDDILIYKASEQKDTFYISPENYGPGDKTLRMIVTTGSNTGSLADLTGGEELSFTQEWKVFLCPLNQGAVLLTRIYNDHGLLKLEWDRYDEPNFQKYNVWVHYPGENYSGLIAEITDQDRTFCHDSTFIGGNPSFWIEVVAGDAGVKGNELKYYYLPPTLKILWTRNDSALLHWNKNEFYRAIREYRISTPNRFDQHISDIVFSTFNAEDTNCVLRELCFGSPIKYELWQFTRKKISLSHSDCVSSGCYLFLGSVIPRSHSAVGIHNKQVLYLRYTDRITKTSIPDGAQLLTFSSNGTDEWYVPPDDQFIFTWDAGKKIKHNSQSFEILNTISFPWSYMPAHNAMSLNCRAIIPLPNGLAMYDFINDRYIFKGKNFELPNAVISPDGKYSFTRKWLYNSVYDLQVHQVTDNGLIEKWSLPPDQYSYVQWLQEDYSKLVVLKGPQPAPPPLDWTDNIRIYDPADQTVLYELDVRIGTLAGITPESGKVAIWGKFPEFNGINKLFLYDYREGMFTSEINLVEYLEYLMLYKTFLISNEGFCLDISEF